MGGGGQGSSLGQHDFLARVAETVEGKRRREEVYDEVSR
jgi:hypothetical protein